MTKISFVAAGRRIVLERKERLTIEASQRIYRTKTHNIEKIHCMQERVKNLNQQIVQDIDRLKEVKNSLTNRKHQDLHADGFPRPASTELKSRNPPPNGLPTKRLPPKRIPAKESPPEGLPSIVSRKPPFKKSTQKELIPGKPLPKKDPIQREVMAGNPPPKDLAPRIRGGCFHCYCYCDQNYTTTCQEAYGTRYNYSIPNSAARRKVTDLNTQDICSNRRFVPNPARNSIAKESRSQQTSFRQAFFHDGSGEKRKSSLVGEGTSRNQNIRQKINEEFTTPYKTRNRPSQLKVESLEKIRPDIVTKSPAEKRGKPKVQDQETKVTDLDAAFPNNRMYQDYLKLYYQENSMKDIREGMSLKPTSTYTKFRANEEIIRREMTKFKEENARNTFDLQRVPLSKDRKKVNPQISKPIRLSDGVSRERAGYQVPKSSSGRFLSLSVGERVSTSTDSKITDFGGTRISNSVKSQSSAPPTRQVGNDSEEESCNEKVAFVDTSCENVTFQNELGDLTEQCSRCINLDHSRTSSSGERTCIESSCDDGETYYSCVERLSWPPLKICPCMYETYRDLEALCQIKYPFYK